MGRRAVCSLCGPVGVCRSGPNGRFRCRVGAKRPALQPRQLVLRLVAPGRSSTDADLARKRAWWWAHRDELNARRRGDPAELERARLYREAHRDQQMASARAWKAANPGRVRELSRSWYLANRDSVRVRTLAWRAAHLDRVRELWRRGGLRRGERSRGFVKFSEAELVARLSMWSGCWIRGPRCTGGFEAVDHVKPLSKGGPHVLANLRPACAACNGWKGARWPLSEVFA